MAQTLQKGISVEMADTKNAAPMPQADSEDAWIVTVTADGSLYFGVEPQTPKGLADKMTRTPRNRQAKLYIKADARAPFADVQKVLETGHTMLFEMPVLLTSQAEPATPGTLEPPKGLEVMVGAPPDAEAIIVQMRNSGGSQPTVLVNNADVSIDVLPSTLGRMRFNRNVDLVVLKAAGTLPFAQVVHVIDACRGVEAKVAVERPEM
jgi:biopolymer transport protein ExbD